MASPAAATYLIPAAAWSSVIETVAVSVLLVVGAGLIIRLLMRRDE
jgi:hypothetical protein